MLVIEGTVRVKEGKKWKERWCQVQSGIDEKDDRMLLITLFKLDQKRLLTHTHRKAVISIPKFCGVHSGFVMDKEQCTMAIVGSENLCTLSLPSERDLQRWESSIRACLNGPEQCFDMFLVETPAAWSRSNAHFVKVFLSDDHVAAISLSPVKHVTSWYLDSIDDFGLRECERLFICNTTLSEKGSGKEEFVFQSSLAKDLHAAMTNKMRCSRTLSNTSAVTSSQQELSDQPLNFYRDLYLSRMYRHSVSSLLSQSRESTPVLSRRDIPKTQSAPRAVSMISSAISKSPISARKINPDYDVPPPRYSTTQRSKDGIYDVPPRRVSMENLLYNHQPSSKKNGQSTAKPNYTRSVSNDSNNNGSLYDTPPTPRRVTGMGNTSNKTDASPKTRREYNSALKYVDLSRFDGPQSDLDRAASHYDTLPARSPSNYLTPRNTHATESTYDTLPSRRVSQTIPNSIPESHYKHPMNRSASTEEPHYQIPPSKNTEDGDYVNGDVVRKDRTNLKNMRRIAKSADNIRTPANYRKLPTGSVSRQTNSQLSLVVSSAEILDDGYVMVSKDATNDSNSKHCEAVKMGNQYVSPRLLHPTARRQHSMDGSGLSSISSIGSNRSMTNLRPINSEDSLSSRSVRTSCSSFSGGSHLSLPSPERRCHPVLKEEESKVYENMKYGTEECESNSNNYMNLDIKRASPVEINYAELDLIKPTESQKKRSSPTTRSRRNSSEIEYAVINIIATEAVRKASKQQEEYRQRNLQTAH